MSRSDVQITINADAEPAQKSVRAVADDIDKLAATLGGELGQQASKAAAQLRQLGQQEAAAQAFVQLQKSTNAAERAFTSLTRQADAYAKQISASGVPTQREVANLQRLQAAADRAGSTLALQKSRMAESAALMQRHGIATDNARQSLDRIRAEIQRTAQQVAQLDPRLKQTASSLDQVGEAADQNATRMSALGRAAHSMAARMTALFTVNEAVQAAAGMEKLQAGLQAVAGDAAQAAREMEFVREMASRAGVDVLAAGDAWLSLSAATKGTSVEGQAARDVFESVTIAMARAGKSSADTQRALTALQQMASKGVVSMEEMRQQLGEALPGAFQAAAAGMGITTRELIRLIESGQVTAQDIFPALTQGLNKLYGQAPQAQTLAQEFANIKNAFADMAAHIGESGGLSALKTGAEVAQAAITMLGSATVAVGKSVGAVLGSIASFDFSQLSQSLTDIGQEFASKFQQASAHNETLRAAMQALGLTSADTASSIKQQGDAATHAGQAAAVAAPSYQALGAAFAEAQKNLQQSTELAEKEVAATKARGEAAVAEAALLDDEQALRRAVGKAAAEEAQALAQVAMRRQAEVDVLALEISEKTKAVQATGQMSAERQKELDQLQQALTLKQTEADRTRAQAAAAKANAQAKSEEVQAAQALLDATQAATTARLADARTSLSLLQTQKELAGQAVEMARLMGDEDAARRARIQQLEIDIKITKAKADVQRAEAEGAIAIAKATRAELAAKGQLTQVKTAELDASIKLAQAKLKEADAIAKSTRLTEQAIANLRRYGAESGNTAKASTRATDAISQGWEKVAASTRDARAEAQAYEEQLGEDVTRVGSGYRNKDGWASDAKGNAFTQTKHNWLSIFEMVKGMGVSEAQAREIADKAYDSRGRYTGQLQKEQMRGQWDSITVTEAARRAAEAILRAGPGLSASASASQGGGTPGSVVRYVSNIRLDGKNTEVEFANAQSQKSTEDLLARLLRAKRSAA